MTDLFFPNTPPDAQELRRIMATRYDCPAPAITSNFFGLKAYAWETKNSVGKPVRLPGQYHHHLSRFLWRHQVFMELQSRFSDLQLAPTHRPLVQRYIQYMNFMVAGLLTTVQKHTKDSSFRCRLFDLYLVVEYSVGRHEFHLVDSWRASNPDTILECQDVLELDWSTFYAQKDTEDPVWSGLQYDFLVSNVPATDWQTLADKAAQYLDSENPSAQRVPWHCYTNIDTSGIEAAATPTKRTARQGKANIKAACDTDPGGTQGTREPATIHARIAIADPAATQGGRNPAVEQGGNNTDLTSTVTGPSRKRGARREKVENDPHAAVPGTSRQVSIEATSKTLASTPGDVASPAPTSDHMSATPDHAVKTSQAFATPSPAPSPAPAGTKSTHVPGTTSGSSTELTAALLIRASTPMSIPTSSIVGLLLDGPTMGRAMGHDRPEIPNPYYEREMHSLTEHHALETVYDLPRLPDSVSNTGHAQPASMISGILAGNSVSAQSTSVSPFATQVVPSPPASTSPPSVVDPDIRLPTSPTPSDPSLHIEPPISPWTQGTPGSIPSPLIPNMQDEMSVPLEELECHSTKSPMAPRHTSSTGAIGTKERKEEARKHATEDNNTLEIQVSDNDDPAIPYDLKSVTLTVRPFRPQGNNNNSSKPKRTRRHTRQNSIPSPYATETPSSPQNPIGTTPANLLSWLTGLASMCDLNDPGTAYPRVADGIKAILNLEHDRPELIRIGKERHGTELQAEIDKVGSYFLTLREQDREVDADTRRAFVLLMRTMYDPGRNV